MLEEQVDARAGNHGRELLQELGWFEAESPRAVAPRPGRQRAAVCFRLATMRFSG